MMRLLVWLPLAAFLAALLLAWASMPDPAVLLLPTPIH
jgi:hypothetical protein